MTNMLKQLSFSKAYIKDIRCTRRTQKDNTQENYTIF